jgi:hypothetical protein
MCKHDHLCGLVLRVPDYTTDMYCASCEVRTEFICYAEESRGTLYPQKLAITSPTSGGRSVGIVRSRTQAVEFSFFFIYRRK